MPEAAGRVFEVQRFCLHDGPGIRTTVFFQGCPLRCVWCHNPEGAADHALLSFQPDKCVACGWCVQVCPRNAHVVDPHTGRHGLARERCTVCGACVTRCYAGALELVGRTVTVTAVLAEVLEDEPFYATSGGGMTLSGGEPLAQVDFAAALLQAARARGLHCAVETCGAVPYARLERILPLVQLFLYDVKAVDPQLHRRCTGADNARILANLRQLQAAGACIRLRLPLVPGLNDDAAHLEAAAALARELRPADGVELMPYHRLGTSKQARFGWQDGFDASPPTSAQVAVWIHAFAAQGIAVRNPQPVAAGPDSSTRR